MKAPDYQAQMILGWSEAVFQNHVLLLAKGYGWLSYHTHDSRRSQPGFPDLVLVHPDAGRILFRELKRQKNARVSPDQHKWLDALTAAGQDAAIWRPSDLVSGEIDRTLKIPRKDYLL